MNDALSALLELAAGDLDQAHWLDEDRRQEYAVCRAHSGQLWQQLLNQLGGDLRKTLELYGEKSFTVHALEEELFFCQGFSLGVQLMTLCLGRP